MKQAWAHTFGVPVPEKDRLLLCALLDKNSDSYVICTMLMHVYLFFAVFTGKNR